MYAPVPRRPPLEHACIPSWVGVGRRTPPQSPPGIPQYPWVSPRNPPPQTRTNNVNPHDVEARNPDLQTDRVASYDDLRSSPERAQREPRGSPDRAQSEPRASPERSQSEPRRVQGGEEQKPGLELEAPNDLRNIPHRAYARTHERNETISRLGVAGAPPSPDLRF